MLTFLRKIRKSLIESSSARKYLLYATGEIALVVIGILIALQINNWNTKRVELRLEREVLANLLSDVRMDIRNLAALDSILSKADFAKRKILDYAEESTLSPDSVFYYLSLTGPFNTFNPSTTTYDEMKNTNAFNVIQSGEIRREISRLYKQYDLVKEREKLYFDSQSRVRNIRIEEFSTSSLHLISSGEIKDPEQILQQIKTSQRFLNALTSNFARNMQITYRDTYLIAQDIKNKLQEYLE